VTELGNFCSREHPLREVISSFSSSTMSVCLSVWQTGQGGQAKRPGIADVKKGVTGRILKTFRTWFSGCEISILGPGFHTGGFTVAFGHGHPLVLLNLNMKCWNSSFNAPCWTVIIVVLQVGAVKRYVAALQALRKKERGDETQFSANIGGKTSLGPSYFVFVKFHSHLHIWCPIMPKLAVLAPLIGWLLQITLMSHLL